MDVDLEIEDEFFEDSGGGFDLDLLLSVAGGLGRFQYTDSGKKVYVKDSDCVGERRCARVLASSMQLSAPAA